MDKNFKCYTVKIGAGDFFEPILNTQYGSVSKWVDFEVRKSAKFENPGKSEFNRILENPDF